MRLIQLTDEQAVWLHGVMQNPLSEDPNPANEDPADKSNRRAIYEATAEDVKYLTKHQVNTAIVHVKTAQDLVDKAQGQFELGSPEWHRLETVDDRLHDALTALGD